jgi:adenylylsulfate kinase-like enzyme
MSNSETTSNKKQPPVILCIGMAGSGKTTFMQVDSIHSILFKCQSATRSNTTSF